MADSKLNIILSLTDQMTPGLKRSEKGVSSFTKSLEKMAVKLVAGIGLFMAVKKAMNITKEAALLNARFETMGVVVDTLGKNVGQSAAEMRELETALETTGISMIGARESIAKLIQADIDLAHATDLARVAQDGAVIAGTNSTEAFEKLIGFISTGNIRVARQIGLFIDLRTAYKEWATANDRAVESLTEQEKAQIRANAAVKAGERISGTYTAAMETAGKQLGSMERDVENLKVTMGGLTNEMLKRGVPATRKFTQELTTLFLALDKLQGNVIEAKDGVDFLDLAMQSMGLNAPMLRSAWEDLIEGLEEYVEVSDTAVVPALDDEKQAFMDLRGAIEEVGGELEEVAPAAEEGLSALEQRFADARAEIDLARGASETFWGSINTGVLGSINSLQSLIDFQQAGGAGVQAAFENIQSALSAGLIDPSEAESALKEVELAAIAVETEVGNIDMNDAIRQVRDEYNVSWQEAKNLIAGAKQFVDSIPARTEKKIEFFIEYTGAPLPGFQHGGSFIVGGQGGADSQMVAFKATPGEKVTVDNSNNSQNFGPFNVSNEVDGQALIESLKTQVRRM